MATKTIKSLLKNLERNEMFKFDTQNKSNKDFRVIDKKGKFITYYSTSSGTVYKKNLDTITRTGKKILYFGDKTVLIYKFDY